MCRISTWLRWATGGIQRLEATADVRNVVSLRVLEKWGFQREGTVRQGKMVIVYCDCAIYGLLRKDWENGER